MTILVSSLRARLVPLGMLLALSAPMEGIGLPAGTFDRGVLGGVVLAMIFFVLVCLMRAFVSIRDYGVLRYLKGAFRIHDDSLGLVLLLLALLLVVLLFFRRD